MPVMSENKRTVSNYIEGFNQSDHNKILSCLTDDVEWEIPGLFHTVGKQAFDQEIENDAFEGRPVITIYRLVEEANVVIAEGSVQSKRKGGDPFKAVFCDIFEMRDTKIKRLVSYLAEVK